MHEIGRTEKQQMKKMAPKSSEIKQKFGKAGIFFGNNFFYILNRITKL